MSTPSRFIQYIGAQADHIHLLPCGVFAIPSLLCSITCITVYDAQVDSEQPAGAWEIGKTVSHYRITGRLGVGAWASRAEDERLSRRVALKFL
jgi:hypothetical protein